MAERASKVSPDAGVIFPDAPFSSQVPFTEVLKLVSERAVFLRGGEAYVPAESIGAVVESRYRVHLSQMLAQTARALPRLDEEDRLLPILRALTKMEVGCGFDAAQATDAVTPEMIDQVRTVVSFETFNDGACNAPPIGVLNILFRRRRVKSGPKVATNDVGEMPECHAVGCRDPRGWW